MTESETGYWVASSGHTSMKNRKKHSDRNCRYIKNSNKRPYRENDPEMDECRACCGELKPRSPADRTYYNMALESE